MKQDYEYCICDIICALHDLEQLTPSEILAIRDVAKQRNCKAIPYSHIFHYFDIAKKHYDDVNHVDITQHDKKVYMGYLRDVPKPQRMATDKERGEYE